VLRLPGISEKKVVAQSFYLY